MSKLIRGGILLSGTELEPLTGSAVLVEDGRIAWIKREGGFKPLADRTIIDAEGATVMPGRDLGEHALSDSNIYENPGSAGDSLFPKAPSECRVEHSFDR